MRLQVDDAAVELDAVPPSGIPLLDLAEAGIVPIESSCRSASCGTCLLRVREGAEFLSGVGVAERDLLEVLAPAGDHRGDWRLGCQVRLARVGPGRCVLTTG